MTLTTTFATVLPTVATGGLTDRAGAVVVLLTAASASWWVVRRRAGRFRSLPTRASSLGPLLTSADLAQDLGTRATFVQFSASTCATCPQVSRVLSGVAAAEPGVVHIDVSSEDHMDLVRRHAVYRTPTVLLLDADGAIRSRTSGPLTSAQALDALNQLAHDSSRSINA